MRFGICGTAAPNKGWCDFLLVQWVVESDWSSDGQQSVGAKSTTARSPEDKRRRAQLGQRVDSGLLSERGMNEMERNEPCVGSK
jgi:hypothetical protein